MLGWWESTRTQPGRARRSITTLPKHTTLDTRALTEGQREKFQDLLEEMRQSPSEWELRPIGKAKDDPARRRLDDAVLQILGASGKAVDAWWKTIVVQWCDEPSVRGT